MRREIRGLCKVLALNTILFVYRSRYHDIEQRACCCVPKVSLSHMLSCAQGRLIVHFHAVAGSKNTFDQISSSYMSETRRDSSNGFPCS
jgi:hypothetical protein